MWGVFMYPLWYCLSWQKESVAVFVNMFQYIIKRSLASGLCVLFFSVFLMDVQSQSRRPAIRTTTARPICKSTFFNNRAESGKFLYLKKKHTQIMSQMTNWKQFLRGSFRWTMKGSTTIPIWTFNIKFVHLQRGIWHQESIDTNYFRSIA